MKNETLELVIAFIVLLSIAGLFGFLAAYIPHKTRMNAIKRKYSEQFESIIRNFRH